MANTKLPARLLDTSAIPALNVTGDLTVDTTTLKVDSTNNRVGIGYGTPAATLDIRTTHTSTDVTAANTNSTLIVGNIGAGNGVYNAIKFAANQQDMYIMSINHGTQASRRLGFFIGSVAGDAVGDERLSIKGDGNVGIGTAIASNKFGIKATSINTDERMINLYTGTTGAGKYVSIGAQYSETNLLSNSEIRFGNEVQSNAPSFLAFATGNTTTPTERMRIDSAGNVGIGDSVPADKLEVNGGTAYPHIRITSSNNTSRYMRIGMEDAVNHVIEANGTSTNLKFKTAGADRVVIGSTGNMSITGSLTVSDVRGPTTTDQYLTFGASRTLRIRNSSGGEYLRVSDSAAGGIVSIGYNNHTAINTMAAIHGLANDATLVLSNTDLSDSATSYGWAGRGGRYLHSNGTGWTNSNADSSDGGDPALVIGSNNTSSNRSGIGIALHNESNANNDFSPMIAFGNKSNSGSYNTVYASIVGKKTGQGGDANWSTGEIHMDTAGLRIGSNTRTAYMDDDPAFKMDEAGDITMPYRSYAYGTWQGSSFNVTNNTGFLMTVLRSQNMTYRNDPTHGFGITIVKPGLYIMNATGLYDPGGTYIYAGWAINGTQVHHWHSNHAIANNHDYVSSAMRQCNTGDHITFENGSQVMTSAWGGSHSSWYITKFG